MFERQISALAAVAEEQNRLAVALSPLCEQVAEAQNRIATLLPAYQYQMGIIGSAFAEFAAARDRIQQAFTSFEFAREFVSIEMPPSLRDLTNDEPQIHPSVVEAMTLPPSSAVDRRIEEQAVEIAELKAQVKLLVRYIRSLQAKNFRDLPEDGYDGRLSGPS